MAKYRVGGNLVVKIDDSGGTLRDLSAYVEWVSPVGVLVEAIDVTVFTDTEQRTPAGVERAQEFTIEGLFDDTASTGPDAVLSGIVGKVGSYQVGKPGSRVFSGEALCLEYGVTGRVGGAIRFQARFRKDGATAVGT